MVEDISILVYIVIIIALYMIDYKPYNLCYLFPYFLIGYKNDIWYKKIKMAWPILFVIGICFWKGKYTVWNSDTNILHGYEQIIINLYRFAIGLVGIATMRMVFDMLYMYFQQFYPKLITSFSNTIGRETFGIYIFHVFIVVYALKRAVVIFYDYIGFNPMFTEERLSVFIIAPVITSFALYVSYKVIKMSKMNRYVKSLWGFKI